MISVFTRTILLYVFPEESNRLAFQLFPCFRYGIQDRQDVPLMLLRIIGFLQDVPGEIALLDGIADHDMLDGLRHLLLTHAILQNTTE